VHEAALKGIIDLIGDGNHNSPMGVLPARRLLGRKGLWGGQKGEGFSGGRGTSSVIQRKKAARLLPLFLRGRRSRESSRYYRDIGGDSSKGYQNILKQTTRKRFSHGGPRLRKKNYI